MLHGFPEYDPDGDGYIQGMFGAILRYFNGSVADIEGFLTDTMNLVAENECNGLTPTEWKRLQGYASRHLFDCPYAVSASTQTGKCHLEAGGRLVCMAGKHLGQVLRRAKRPLDIPKGWCLLPQGRKKAERNANELRRADHEVHDIADGRYDGRIQKFQQGMSR